MAKHNLALLYGSLLQKPVIHISDITGEADYAHCTIEVVRGYREVGDHKKIKYDNPTIMTREPSIIQEMSTWEQYDIVEVKGVIACKTVKKGSICKHCGERNFFPGALVYINPIFAKKRVHLNSEDECVQFLNNNREISNQVFVFGRLCRDPKKITPLEGLTVTQYQIALNRKYRIRSDPPEIRSDFPWVKSYGENAKSDRKFLHVGSEIFVDGCLQARSVQRHGTCTFCGEEYTWRDRAMEIVPYEIEYINHFYSEDEADEIEKKREEDRVKSILGGLKGISGNNDDDELTESDYDDGFTDGRD